MIEERESRLPSSCKEVIGLSPVYRLIMGLILGVLSGTVEIVSLLNFLGYSNTSPYYTGDSRAQAVTCALLLGAYVYAWVLSISAARELIRPLTITEIVKRRLRQLFNLF